VPQDILCNAPQLVPYILCEYDRSEYVWTEALQWYQGFLYESTGLASDDDFSGLNQLRFDLEAKKVTVKKLIPLPSPYFAEGLARDGNTLYQLDKDTNDVLLYEVEPLKRLPNLPGTSPTSPEYKRWGLCYDSNSKIFYLGSNGSNVLECYTKSELGSGKPNHYMPVMCGKQKVGGLNSLEFVGGFIYAAVWRGEDSNQIVKINSSNGNVVAQIDAKNLRENQQNPEAKDLNGIAHYRTDPTDGQEIFFVTGKCWSKIFEVKFAAPEFI
jgi:glutaminyl-peptide cyclotransferase